jgi:hypothetical protein
VIISMTGSRRSERIRAKTTQLEMQFDDELVIEETIELD